MFVEKRKFQRFSLNLETRCLGGGHDGTEYCRITEISRQGLVVESSLNKKTSIGKTLFFSIDLPGQETPVNAVAKIKWMRQEGTDSAGGFKAGCKITLINDTATKKLLEHAYSHLLNPEGLHRPVVPLGRPASGQRAAAPL